MKNRGASIQKSKKKSNHRPWEVDEDDALLNATGGRNYNEITHYEWAHKVYPCYQQNLKDKNKVRELKRVKERYKNYVDPAIKDKAKLFTQEEIELLIKKVEMYGKIWAFLTKFFENRTENQLKNLYYSKRIQNMLKSSTLQKQLPNSDPKYVDSTSYIKTGNDTKSNQDLKDLDKFLNSLEPNMETYEFFGDTDFQFMENETLFGF